MDNKLPVTGERMGTKYWLTAMGMISQEKCGRPDMKSAIYHEPKVSN